MKISTDSVYSYRYGRNGKFSITVGPVTRTVGLLTAVKEPAVQLTWDLC